MANSEKLLLLDGHSILNRAFYGIPMLTNAAGMHTNAVYGFLMILWKALEDEAPDYLVVAFDVKAPTFRHKMYEEYKGTRKGMPEELREQVPVMKEVLHAMGVATVEQAGLEADDLLGSLSAQAEAKGMEVAIVSGDRDLLQLASEKIKISLAKPKKGGSETVHYYAKDVVETYGVTPLEFIDVKALMGDTSDNIPGLPGVGEKTATKLIAQYHSIDEAYAHLEEIKPKKAQDAFREHFDLAKLSKELATIDRSGLAGYSFEQARLGTLYTPEAYQMFKQLEFKQFLGRFQTAETSPKAETSMCRIQSKEEFEALLLNIQNQPIGVSIYQTDAHHPIRMAAIYVEKTVYLLDAQESFLSFLSDSLLSVMKQSSEVRVMSVKDLKRALLVSSGESIREDLKEQNCFDVHLAAYLLNPLKSVYLYDDLASEYLQETVASAEELLGKVKWAKAYEQAHEALEQILMLECQTVSRVRESLTEQLRESGMWELYETIELPLSEVLLQMERLGISARKERLEEYGNRLQERIGQLEQEIFTQAGESFNIQSPKQLGHILFEKLMLKGGKKTKTGYSTAADVLEKLAPEYPIVADVLEYRQMTKLKATYAEGLAGCIEKDGRIHSTFHQTITATGRISSAEPNLQNIPIRTELGREIRKVFVPEEGYVFVDADYSQIELRVLAHMSGDEMLIDAYRQEEDIHKMTASQVFHVPFEEVTPELRRNAKAVNFGIVYGISAFGLSQDLGISVKEAQEYIDNYFATYPKIKSFLDGLVEETKSSGYSYTMYRRRRPVPELSSSNFMQRSFGERVAMNSPIQGTAADIIKIAMLRVDGRLHRRKMKSRLILQVHDELLIEAWKEELPQVEQLLKEEMEAAAELLVPLLVDVHTGESWYDTK